MKVAVIGRSEFAYNTAKLLLQHNLQIPLIITAREAPEYKSTMQDFEILAHTCNATFINTPNVNTPSIIEQIKSVGLINLGVSVNYSGIISQEVIDIFPLGILNAHGGDLPRYRGNACQAWAIINGEQRMGLCIHKMIGNELDSGDIIDRKYHPINLSTRIGDLYNWMEHEIPLMMLESIAKLANDKDYFLEKQSKNPADALRCYPRTPADCKIDFRTSNINVLRLINASSEPYSGAYCILDNEILKIWRAEMYHDEENYLAVPGQISALNNDGSITVICGEGKLKITNVEYKGVRTSTLTSVIKSIRKRLL